MSDDKPIHPPILLYHDLMGLQSPNGRGPSGKETLARQMRYLASHGYTTLSSEQFCDLLDAPGSVPHRAVCLSFDDGWGDFYEDIFPILAELGLVATVFIVTAVVGGQYEAWSGPRPSVMPPTLSWSQIEEMSRAGMSFGSHTQTHPRMTNLSPSRLAEEVTVSKQVLEDHLGRPVSLFAYPYGVFDDAAKRAVRDAGYRAAFVWTSKELDRFELRRRSVTSSKHLFSFKLRLSRTYPAFLSLARLSGIRPEPKR